MSWYSRQHAVVTGGGSGIGAAIAEDLVNTGAMVTIMGRGEVRLKATAKRIGAACEVCDVTDRSSVAKAFAAARSANGRISILVNNAGTAEAMPFAKMQDEFWDRLLSVNLDGVFNCTRAVAGEMLDAKSGRIVNIGSTASLKGYAYIAAYCAAKHGVLGLTRALALEFASQGVTVNAVCPGYTNTDIVDNAIDKIMSATGRSRDEAMAELVKANPQGRLVEPSEVASTVRWLCDESSGSITGQAIAVAGGEVM
ncbi:MAG: SDR family NAD(P)-dependent oxidoreductase [Gammaproteobacteria bacterium]|nr:SDR family NAD(P)-dependent oxidoreductase [Gammaproteobacteria bacterium]